MGRWSQARKRFRPWQAAPVSGALTLQYQVYAWDLSVRGAHLDQTHGFYNGTSVFLRVVGQEMVQHVVDIQNRKIYVGYSINNINYDFYASFVVRS